MGNDFKTYFLKPSDLTRSHTTPRSCLIRNFSGGLQREDIGAYESVVAYFTVDKHVSAPQICSLVHKADML